MTRSRATPWLFLAPALIVTGAIIVWPVLQTAWMSLHDVILFRPLDRPFVGLGNFARALHDEVFWISLGNSVVWIVAVVAAQFLLGFAAALVLNQSFAWRSLARSLVVVPWALPSVIIGLIWTWMYDFNLGVLNDVGMLDPTRPKEGVWVDPVAGTAVRQGLPARLEKIG